ncbi:hypothetical protein GCM10009768_19580 [Leucobacter iarius]|uniref:Uncharacterized protein n=1 Tax=Leucobacter iarius TaxID=333963 RepID=A0ABN2LKG5_9MICO
MKKHHRRCKAEVRDLEVDSVSDAPSRKVQARRETLLGSLKRNPSNDRSCRGEYRTDQGADSDDEAVVLVHPTNEIFTGAHINTLASHIGAAAPRSAVE